MDAAGVSYKLLLGLQTAWRNLLEPHLVPSFGLALVQNKHLHKAMSSPTYRLKPWLHPSETGWGEEGLGNKSKRPSMGSRWGQSLVFHKGSLVSEGWEKWCLGVRNGKPDFPAGEAKGSQRAECNWLRVKGLTQSPLQRVKLMLCVSGRGAISTGSG